MRPLEIALVGLAILVVSPGCDEDCVTGNGPIVTEELSIPKFNAIRSPGSYDINIEQGPVQRVTATGNKNVIDRLQRQVSDSLWNVRLEEGCYNSFQLEIDITMPRLELIELLGSGNINLGSFTLGDQTGMLVEGSGDITQNGSFALGEDLRIQSNGSGNVRVGCNAPVFVAALTGSGDIQVSGKVRRQGISMTGSGNYRAFDLASDSCSVNLNGSGNAQVTVDSFLNVVLLGSGNILYRGNPEISSIDNGSGNLIDAN